MKIKFTCQICGRDIKAPKSYPKVENAEEAGFTETIAHHGYKRPWKEGWQTGSCFGARYRPYEVACDALPLAIEAIRSYLERLQTNLKELMAAPPDEFKCERKDAWRRTKEEWTTTKPDGFDPNNCPDDYNPKSYVHEFRSRRFGLESDIKHTTSDLKKMRERLTNWKAPK